MFTKLTLRNFRCFDRIELDLTSKKNSPKHLVLIYGENGAGKSNLISAFVLLNELMETMNVRDTIEELISRKAIFNDEDDERYFKQQLLSELRDMEAIINDVRMVGCYDTIVAEYEFAIDGRIGTYTVELGESEIVHERLEFLLSKRRGVFFDCKDGKLHINEKLFKSAETKTAIDATARRYWGKHSILAIILHEMKDKSKSFGWDNLSDSFLVVLSEFLHFSSAVKIGSRTWTGLQPPLKLLTKAKEGTIPSANEEQLDLLESIFTSLFSATNADIRRAYYNRKYNGSTIRYRLFFEKKIAGEYRQIDFSKESTGTHHLLNMFCYILTASVGGTVVIDEADSGIHDALFRKILQETYDKIEGQLIMTTHNTMLMEARFSRDAIYILRETDDEKTEIRCVNEFEKRTYMNNNIRNKYINNEYGGFPIVSPIEIEKQISALQKYINRRI